MRCAWELFTDQKVLGASELFRVYRVQGTEEQFLSTGHIGA